jgi:hypothetical protein
VESKADYPKTFWWQEVEPILERSEKIGSNFGDSGQVKTLLLLNLTPMICIFTMYM